MKRFLMYRKKSMYATIGCCIISLLITLYWNVCLCTMIDQVQTGIPITTRQIGTVLFLVIVSAISQGGVAYMSGYTGEYLCHDLRMQLAGSLCRKSYEEIELKNTGEQSSLLQNELVEITAYIAGGLFLFINDMIRFVLTFAWLLYKNAKLTIFSNIPLVLILVYILYSSKIIERLTKVEQEKQKQMNGFLDILLNLFPIIRIYEAQMVLQNRFDETVVEWENITIRDEMTKAKLMSLSAILSCTPLLLTMLVGGLEVIYGKLSIGVVYIFINLSGNVSGVMMNMPEHLARFRRFQGNIKRIQKEMGEE